MIQLDEGQARQFLARNNIDDCKIVKVAGDASFRSYYRIIKDEKKWILMFAPPSHEDIKPFIVVDNFLVAQGFSAPHIIAIDDVSGFILLEDFGDDTYSHVLKAKQEDLKDAEWDLYKKACDCLLELHKIKPLKDLRFYNNAELFREVMLFVDWYLPAQKKDITLEEKAHFKHLWFDLFDQLSKENQISVLRDYHADNLMVLANRAGYKQVGLLDFQDALIGSKAYDLVSLLEDARRDLNDENRQSLLQYYLNNFDGDKQEFLRDYAILSLQRNPREPPLLGFRRSQNPRRRQSARLGLQRKELAPRLCPFPPKDWENGCGIHNPDLETP